MKRRQLADILRRVEPALSKKDYVPIFTCFCFDGETVTTSDGTLTMQAPCPWDLRGGVDAGVLNFLRHRQTEQDVIAISDGDGVVIRLGQEGDGFRSTLRPQDQFLHSLPDDEGSVALDVGDLFPDCLRKCSLSLGLDPGHAWRLGVTLAFTEGRITFYSSDDILASRAVLDRRVPDELVGRSVILSPFICPVLLKADRRDRLARIIIHDKWTKAVFNSGLILFSETVFADEGEPSLSDHAVKKYTERYESVGADYADTVPIPDDFDDLLTCVHGSVGPPLGDWHGWVWLSIVDGPNGPRVHVEQAREVAVEGPIGKNQVSVHGSTAIGLHDDCRVCVPAEHVRRALRYVTEMAIVEEHLVLRGQDLVHLVVANDDCTPPKPDPNSFRRWAKRHISQMFDDCGQPWLPLNESVFEIMVATKAEGFALRSEETIRLVARSLGIDSVQMVEGPIRWLWWWPSKVELYEAWEVEDRKVQIQTDDDVEGLDLDLAQVAQFEASRFFSAGGGGKHRPS